jgi:hypothetical protein
VYPIHILATRTDMWVLATLTATLEADQVKLVCGPYWPCHLAGEHSGDRWRRRLRAPKYAQRSAFEPLLDSQPNCGGAPSIWSLELLR